MAQAVAEDGALDGVNGPYRSSISRVIDLLREDIISVAIPPGSKLRIAVLAERYEANPGAVREALSRLVPEGLVLARDQKGFQASPISAAQLNDIMETRIFIEMEALHRSIETGDTEWEANVVASAHRLAKAPQFDSVGNLSVSWRRLHRGYHYALISACGSPTLLQLQGLLYAQSERYRCLRGSLSSGDKPRSSVSEHDHITAATLARDFDTAGAALTQHYRKTVELLISAGLVE
jgi:GntR family transcriptional regulator, carbon starvation induced regulator